jgi:hypothetical protein
VIVIAGLLAALGGCADADDPALRRTRPGNPETDDGDYALVEDTGDTGSLEEDPLPPTGDTGEACFLGPDRTGDVCFPTWGISPAEGDYQYPAPYDGSTQYIAPVRFLDLLSIDPASEIAPNFALGELAQDWKGPWAVVQPHLIVHLQAIRDEVGAPLTVNSGYRSPAYNASIDGVTYSRHQYGDAADLDADGLSVEELGDLCYAAGAAYVGLYENSHTHCDWRDDSLSAAFYDPIAERRAPLPQESATIRCDEVCRAPASGFDEGEPFRRWSALGADGTVLARDTGREFAPPPGTQSVAVVVGGRVALRASLP